MVLDGRHRKNGHHGAVENQISPDDDPHDDCTHWVGFI